MRIRIIHGGASFTARGKVAYASVESGVGIVFTGMEKKDELILEKWIDELRTKRL
jgi:hypothetical protein